MKMKTSLLSIGLIAMLVLTSASVMATKQEILKYDTVAFRSDYGDMYASAEDPYWEGQIRLKNDYTRDFDDVKVTFVIQELGYRRSFSPFDIKDDEYFEQRYPLSLDESLDSTDTLEPGVYYVRVTTGKDDLRRVKYRELVVY